MIMFLFANSDNRWRCDRSFSLWIKDGCFSIEDSVNQLEKLLNKIFFVKLNYKNVKLRVVDSTIYYFV